ncbi:hypothetical protein C8J57DRAFT_1050451, partial [Mycena rebaudengoi]
MATPSEKTDIIHEWQAKLNPRVWLPVPCAVCAQVTRKLDILVCDPKDINLSLLRNEHLPIECLPTTYNLEAYESAILYHPALSIKDRAAPFNACNSCVQALSKGKQPLDSIANFQYYARDELPSAVRLAFAQATAFDLMMVGRSRATRITHLFSRNPKSVLYGTADITSQRYSQGNVAIFAQDVPTVRTLLPPDISEIREAMCALFVGSTAVPSRENIKKLSPVLVSKNRVATLIDFLLSKNEAYMTASVEYSADNMDALFASADQGQDVAVPTGIELACLPEPESSAGTSSYTDRGDMNAAPSTAPPATFDNLAVPRDQLVMEAVGYMAGDTTAVDYQKMKATALAWCLDKKKYISMRSGSKFISDRDPSLLTFTFPRLDPWGIGGFLEPRR